MDNKNIVLIAQLKVKEDAVDAAKAAALAIVEQSRSEAGCINYDVHQSIEDETVFIWHETWRDQAAIDEHFATDFFQKFFATVEPLAAEPPVITLTNKLT